MFTRREAAAAISPTGDSLTAPTQATVPTQSSAVPLDSTESLAGNAVVTPSIGRGMVARLKSLGLAATKSVPSADSVSEKETFVKPQQTLPTKTQIKPEDVMIPILTHHEKPPVIKKGEAGNRQVLKFICL